MATRRLKAMGMSSRSGPKHADLQLLLRTGVLAREFTRRHQKHSQPRLSIENASPPTRPGSVPVPRRLQSSVIKSGEVPVSSVKSDRSIVHNMKSPPHPARFGVRFASQGSGVPGGLDGREGAVCARELN